MTRPFHAKEEFPPLYPEGFHETSLRDIRNRCVDHEQFRLSSARGPLMDQFEETIMSLLSAGVIGSVWLDGSFVTEKINPVDIDFVLEIESNVYDSGSAELRQA